MNGTCLGCSAGYKGATCESGMYLFLTIHYNSLNNQIDASFIRSLKQCVFLKEKKTQKTYVNLKKKEFMNYIKSLFTDTWREWCQP